MTAAQMLSESVEDAMQREAAAFIWNNSVVARKVVLFGLGMLGRKTFSILKDQGIKLIGVVDNDPIYRTHGFEGLNVVPVSQIPAAWKDDAVFVVTIFRPLDTEGLFVRMKALSKAGCRLVYSFLEIAWRFPGILPHFGADLPSRILLHASELVEINSLWADEHSREVFRQQLAWRLRADFSQSGPPTSGQYFPDDILTARFDERFVDCGAYDGDTLRALPEGFECAWAIEPDPETVRRLRQKVDSRVTVFETALGDRCGTIRFDSLGSTASHCSEDGSIEVRLSQLDELIGDGSPTFIKLDVEGNELSALRGSKTVLRRTQPVVAVCIYHRPEDLWEIPRFLSETLPNHRMFLRVHEHDGFELVVYAVPKSRCVQDWI
jgi:FkbM family methyltransferase